MSARAEVALLIPSPSSSSSSVLSFLGLSILTHRQVAQASSSFDRPVLEAGDGRSSSLSTHLLSNLRIKNSVSLHVCVARWYDYKAREGRRATSVSEPTALDHDS